MTKNTYNPYEIMMDKYDKEEMLSDVREAMLYQLGTDVSCEELDHFFTGKGKAALSACRRGRNGAIAPFRTTKAKLVILEARIFGADAHFSRSAALCGKGSHPAWSSIHGASPPSVQNTLR